VRAAGVCLAFHAALSLFSAVAFATFLSPPYPAWLMEPTNQEVMRLGFKYGPATTVVLGALAGVLHAAGKLGRQRAALIFVFGFVISLASELSGTGTGYPFGPYSYSGLLGYKIGGLVPFNIPTSWFFMLYCSLAICGRLLRPRTTGAPSSCGRWPPASSSPPGTSHGPGDGEDRCTGCGTSSRPAEQTLVERIFVSDIFYGMPLSNWLGWILTGIVVARVMLAFVPPSAWARTWRQQLPALAVRRERRPAHHHLRQERHVVGGRARLPGDGAAARARRARRGPARSRQPARAAPRRLRTAAPRQAGRGR
jgi:putative membrane protein